MLIHINVYKHIPRANMRVLLPLSPSAALSTIRARKSAPSRNPYPAAPSSRCIAATTCLSALSRCAWNLMSGVFGGSAKHIHEHAPALAQRTQAKLHDAVCVVKWFCSGFAPRQLVAECLRRLGVVSPTQKRSRFRKRSMALVAYTDICLWPLSTRRNSHKNTSPF
jgi:hypothetical protein